MSVREFVSLHADEWAVVDLEGQSPRASTRGVSSKILPDAALSGCFDHSDWSGAILSCRSYLMRSRAHASCLSSASDRGPHPARPYAAQATSGAFHRRDEGPPTVRDRL